MTKLQGAVLTAAVAAAISLSAPALAQPGSVSAVPAGTGSSTAAATSPLIANGKFIGGTAGWKSTSASTTLSTVVLNNNRSAQLARRAAGLAEMTDSPDVTTSARKGETLHVSGLVKVRGWRAIAGQVEVREMSAAGRVLKTTSKSFSAWTSWRSVRFPVAATADGSRFDVTVRGTLKSTASRLLVDNITLTPSASASASAKAPDPTKTSDPTAKDPEVAPTAPVKPSARTTGVPAGTVLKAHHGDLTVTKPGTVLNGLDIRGFVTIKADNVTIRNSVVRGGKATYNRGIVTNYGYRNLLIEDSDFIPAYETVWQDGIKGNNFTARRVHVVGNVDSVKIHTGGNVTIEDSLLENTVYYASDPNQRGGPTHNDGIQILDGDNIRITGNTIRGHHNFAVLGAANKGATRKLVLTGNWLDGGHCTLKLEPLKGLELSATVSGNKFGPNRRVSHCAFQAVNGTKLTEANNTFELTGSPVKPYWTAS